MDQSNEPRPPMCADCGADLDRDVTLCADCQEAVDAHDAVTYGEDCCGSAEAGFECSCAQRASYRGEDRVRGLD